MTSPKKVLVKLLPASSILYRDRCFLYLTLSEVKGSHSVVSDSLRPHGLQPTRILSPWDFPGKNTGVGCHFFLQGIFPTQGSNLGLPHCRQTLYRLSYHGSPYLVYLQIFHINIARFSYKFMKISNLVIKHKHNLLL